MVDSDATGAALGYFNIGTYGAAAGGSGAVVGVRVQGFARTNTRDRPHGVVNDFIASRLGAAIGLPVPPGALIRTGNGVPSYLSLGFSDHGDRLPPAILQNFARERPWEACGVIAFDQWVANSDRHDENLAYVPEIGVAVIDHDLALLGRADDPLQFLRSGLDLELKNHPLPPLMEAVTYMDHWTGRIAVIHSREIRNVVHECYVAKLITSQLKAAICDFLEYRQRRVSTFITRTMSEYRSVRSWPLGFGEVSDVS